jgi:predicted cupin superfamily sugar epimerase
MSIPARARRLGMEPHPEGGWFVRTWTATPTVQTAGGPRPTATLIHFLLPAGEVSTWHRVVSDEVWLWHGPGPLALQLGGDGDEPDEAGPVHPLGDGEADAFQAVVPAGVWQRTLPGEREVLVSCLVSPGFDYADWELREGSAIRGLGSSGDRGRTP